MKTPTRLVKNQFDGSLRILYEKKELSCHCTLHCHDFTELDLILDGEGETILNGATFPIRRGATSLLSLTDFHAYTVEKPLSILNVQFASDHLRDMSLPASDTPICYLNETELQRICLILEHLETLNSDLEEERICAERLLEAALNLLCPRIYSNAPCVVSPPPIGKAIAYIHAHFKENPSLEMIANTVFLDKRYFCTLFHNYMGKSYKTYLREIKLGYAARLLRCTPLSVMEISSESGYASISHFNREFLAFYGVSPTKMRKQTKAEPNA